MPIYEFKDNKTGDIFTKVMSYDEKVQFMKDNDCSSHFTPSSMPAIIRETGDVHSRTTSDFKERMAQIKKNAGRQTTLE